MKTIRYMPQLALIVLLVLCAFLSACGGGGSDSSPPPNTPPLANAGADANAFKKEAITLNGSASTDKENDPLTYVWTQISGPAVSLSNAAAAQPTFAAPASAGTLIFSLLVNDGKVSSVADTVTITVIDRMPVAAADSNRNVRVGTAVVLDGRSSTDPDGDTLTYIWTQTSGPAAVIKDNKDGTIGFAAPSTPQVLGFSLRVSDGELTSSTADVVVAVSFSGNNSAPIVDAGFDQVVPRSRLVNLSGFAYDPDSQPLTVQWKQISGPSVTLQNATTTFASFTAPSTSATFVFELSATDGVLAGVPDRVTVTVQDFAPLVSVTLTPSAPKVTNALTATTNVSDPDGESVTTTFAWSRNGTAVPGQTGNTLPAGSFVKGDSIAITVTASDGTLSTVQSATVVIQDSPPVLSASPPTTVNYGAVFSFRITATDADGDAIQYVIHHGPAGMQVDSSGNVTWTAQLPLFDRTLDVSWGIGISGSVTASLSGTVQVMDANRQYALRRTGSEVPISHHGVIVTDLDGDGHDEMLVGSRKTLYEMGLAGSAYVQRWVYPYSLGSGDITSIAAADTDGDHKQEIFVSTTDHLYKLDGVDRGVVANLSPSAGFACKDMVAADLNNDGTVELVCLGSINYGKARVVVFNAQTGAVVWQSPEFDNVTDIAVGNVDGDAAKEIILSNGFVYDGATFANEWASSTPFGTYLTTGDVDGDGIDEVIGFQIDHVAAWDIVHRTLRWQLAIGNYYNVRGLSAVDLDGDGTTEIVTTGDTYNSVGAYHRNSSTGATELVFAIPNISTDSIVQYALGDINNDGTRELVLGMGGPSSFGAKFVGVTIQAPQAVVWSRDLTSEPSGVFSGGQFAKTLPSARRLIFGTSQSGYYSGPRIVSLNPLTGLFTQTSVLGTSSGQISIDMTDYDADGIDEAFVAVPYGAANYVAYDVEGDVTEWSSPGSSSFYSSIVTHADLNDDGFPDLVGISGDGYVVVYDAHNQTLIWKSDQLGSGVDIAVADVDGDGVQEIVALSYNKLIVYEKNSGPNKFKERVSSPVVPQYSYGLRDLLVADTDGDGKPEIFVLSQNYSATADLFKFNGALVQQAKLSAPDYPQAIYLENLGNGRKNIVIGTTGDSYNGIAPSFYAIDPTNGTKIWQSPALPAPAQPNSLQYVDTNGDGIAEISFANAAGMFLTR